MRIGLSLPSKGNPSSGVKAVISSLTDESWLGNLPDGHQTERLATRWTWDAAYTTLQLKLRHGVSFHDGTPLTADLAAAILRQSVKDKEAPSFAGIESVTASGTDTVDIHLSRPDTLLVQDLTSVNVRCPTKGDGTAGPFAVISRGSAENVLRAFPGYYRGRPALDEIDIKTYPTQRNAWAALMRGDIDMLHEVSRDAAEFVKAESTVNTYVSSRPYVLALVFNVRRPVLQNATVRKALNEALDRSSLVSSALNGWGRPADGPIPPDHWAYSPGTPFGFDPDASRAMLESAGYRLKPAPTNGIPNRFKFTCLVYTGDSRFEHLAILVQKQLADVGVEMTLVPVKDSAELEDRLKNGEFDAFLFEMYGRTFGLLYQFWHSQEGLIDTGYRAADAALDRLRASRSDAEMKAAIVDLTRVMHDDPPAAFLAWQTTIRAVSNKFDVQPEQNRDIFFNAWQWRLAAPNQQAAGK